MVKKAPRIFKIKARSISEVIKMDEILIRLLALTVFVLCCIFGWATVLIILECIDDYKRYKKGKLSKKEEQELVLIPLFKLLSRR